MNNDNIQQRLELIYDKFKDEKFLSNKGLSNEVGIHIFTYDPQYEMMIRSFINNLVDKEKKEYNIIVYDLYDLFINILEDKRLLDKVGPLEQKKGKSYLLEQLHKVATPEMFLEKIKYSNHKTGDIVLISGVGKVFPFLSTQRLFNIMHDFFSDVPIVVFYPGDFDGHVLSLFDRVPDGNYCRAFNLI